MTDQVILVEGMIKTYKYIGTPKQLKNQSKFKVINGKVRIIMPEPRYDEVYYKGLEEFK